MLCGLPWLLFGIVLAECALCPNEDGLKVIQICTDDSVTSDVVAIATDGLPDTSTLNCSCTVTVYRVEEDRVPVLYFEGPGYPNCGIQISVGGLVFSCFPGFLNLEETFFDITFRKTTTKGNPAACLLFISANPNTKLKVTCHKSGIVLTKPLSSTSVTTSTRSSIPTTPWTKSLIYTTTTTTPSSHRPNRTTSFIESTTGSSKSSLTSSESSTESVMDSSTKDTESSSASSTDTSFSTTTTSMLNTSLSASVTSETLSPSVGSKITTTESKSTSSDSHSAFTDSSFPLTTTAKQTTDSKAKTSAATGLSGNVSSPTTSVTQQITETSLSTIGTFTTQKSSQETTQISLTPSSPTDNPKLTTEIDSSSSVAEDNNVFVIVTAACSGFFVIIPMTLTMVLFIRRKQLDRTILKQASTASTPAPYIDAFENETEIIIDDSVYYTGATAMQKYRPVGTFKGKPVTSPGNQVNITETPFRPHKESVSNPDTNVASSTMRQHGHVTSNSRETQFENVSSRPSFNQAQTETVIYAVVTKQPKSLAMQPRPKLISFKGIDETTPGDEERETADARKPMTQFGVLKKRESLRAVKSVAKDKSDRDLATSLRKSHSQRNNHVS